MMGLSSSSPASVQQVSGLSVLPETAGALSLPPESQQWVCSSTEAGGEAGEFFSLTCPLDSQGSEAIQEPLFEPSQIVIAKVESISDDSLFSNSYFRILGSEAEVETSHVATSSSFQTLAQEVSNSFPPVSSSPAIDAAPAALPTTAVTLVQTEIVSSEQADVCVDNGTYTVACQSPVLSTFDQPTETVEDYVIAETSPASLPIASCLQLDMDDPELKTHQTGSENLLVLPDAQEESESPYTLPGQNPSIMWSPPSDTSIPLPQPLLVASASAPTENIFVKEDENICMKEEEKNECSILSAVAENLPEKHGKKRIIKVKRKSKATVDVKQGPSSSEASTCSSSNKKTCQGRVKLSTNSKGSVKCPLPSGGGKSEEAPARINSRSGRVIKPSWKVVKASTDQTSCSLKCTSPTRKVSVWSETAVAKTDSKSSPLGVPGSLSLSAATKELPEISATVSKPSVLPFPSSLEYSMSLETILAQMREDEASSAAQTSQALEFAESLFSDVPLVEAGDIQARDGERDEEKQPRERTVEVTKELKTSENIKDSDSTSMSSVQTKSMVLRLSPQPPSQSSSSDSNTAACQANCGSSGTRQSSSGTNSQANCGSSGTRQFSSGTNMPQHQTSSESGNCYPDGKHHNSSSKCQSASISDRPCPSSSNPDGDKSSSGNSNSGCQSTGVCNRPSNSKFDSKCCSGGNSCSLFGVELTLKPLPQPSVPVSSDGLQVQHPTCASSPFLEKEVEVSQPVDMDLCDSDIEPQHPTDTEHFQIPLQADDDALSCGNNVHQKNKKGEIIVECGSENRCRKNERERAGECGSEAVKVSGTLSSRPAPPKMTGKKDHRSEEEDRIEIFAEDIDMFTHYTMDEKRRTPPQMPTPPSEWAQLATWV